MTSERALMVMLLHALLAGGCADLSRGQPRSDTAAPASLDAAADTNAATDASAARSFARDVHPLVLEGCARCHADNGAAANTAFVLVDDAAKDRLQVLAQVNPDQPAGSRILAKTAGLGHVGGAIYAAGSAEYRIILEWIMQGSVP